MLIECGKWNYYYKYLIFASIFGILTKYLFGYIYNYNMDLLLFIDTDVHKELSEHIFYHYIFRYLGLFIISIIAHKFESKLSLPQKKTNSTNFVNEEESSDIKLIYNSADEDMYEKIKISPLYTFIILFLMVFQVILGDIFHRSHLKVLSLWMLELPLLAFLSLKSLNFKIYRHHILAICLTLVFYLTSKIISVLSLTFTTDINEGNDNKLSVYKHYRKHLWLIPFGAILYLIILTSRDYSITKIKVFMDLKYISPNKILIIYGFIGLIISIIIGTISTFAKCTEIGDIDFNICTISNNDNQNDNQAYYLENFYLYWEKLTNSTNGKIEIFYEISTFTVGVICNFFYYYFYILVIQFLTPTHIFFMNAIIFFFLKIFAYIKYYIYNQVEYDEERKYNTNIRILFYIGGFIDIIGIFGLLIYLEIIVLNFCGFNYNLRESIAKRSISEYELNKIGKINNVIEGDGEEEEEEEKDINEHKENLVPIKYGIL